MPRDFGLACHEAGHAVAALVLGYNARIILYPGDGTEGVTKTSPLFRNYRDDAIVSMAGAVAQLFHDPGSLSPAHVKGDDERAWHACLALAHGDVNRARDHWQRTRLATVDLIADNWPAIERLTKALLERGALDAEAVRKVAGQLSVAAN
ncbi:MAG TPA: hypothetical protein VJ890_24950 [Vineibacter sp.]|nr:hypothetical protein [Vineibacter sp.]